MPESEGDLDSREESEDTSRSVWVTVPITEPGCPRGMPDVGIKGLSWAFHLLSVVPLRHHR